MICAFCGERAASAFEDSRPICRHCAELPEPTPLTRRGIFDPAFSFVTQSPVMGRDKVETPCPYCGEKFGARELREHLPRCPKRPKEPE